MLTTYKFGDVSFVFRGSLANGYADGECITIEVPEDQWLEKEGSDGQIHRSLKPLAKVLVKLKLMQTSPYNDFLSNASILDVSTGEGAGSLLIKDVSGSNMLMSSLAYIKRLPNQGYGVEVGTREWTFTATAPVMNVGGNIPNIPSI